MSRVLAAVVVAGLALAGCGDDSATPSLAENLPPGIDGLISLEIVDGDPVGGAQTADFSQGDKVRIEISGDSDDQVHVHAYDHYIDLVDGAGDLEFDALIPGTFEIELEGSGRLLVRMKVS